MTATGGTDAADRSLGLQVDVGGLGRVRDLGVGGFLQQRAEGGVHPVDDGCDRAEVGRELDRALGRGANRSLRRHEHGDVGATEPVDRLLRVADHEQAPGLDLDVGPTRCVGLGGVEGRDAHGELDLDRVGVLELVEQQPLVPLVEGGPHDGTLLRVAQHLPRQDEQVVELEGARRPGAARPPRGSWRAAPCPGDGRNRRARSGERPPPSRRPRRAARGRRPCSRATTAPCRCSSGSRAARRAPRAGRGRRRPRRRAPRRTGRTRARPGAACPSGRCTGR